MNAASVVAGVDDDGDGDCGGAAAAAVVAGPLDGLFLLVVVLPGAEPKCSRAQPFVSPVCSQMSGDIVGPTCHTHLG